MAGQRCKTILSYGLQLTPLSYGLLGSPRLVANMVPNRFALQHSCPIAFATRYINSAVADTLFKKKPMLLAKIIE